MSTDTLNPTTNIAEHAKDLHRAARSVACDLKTEANNRFGDLKSQAGSRLSDAQDAASDGFDKVKGFIKEHPVAAVGFGVFAGLLLASWARSRR